MDEAPPDETVAEIDRKTNYVIEHNELPSLRSRRHSLILLADRAIGRTPAAPRALQLVLLKMLTPLALRERRGFFVDGRQDVGCQKSLAKRQHLERCPGG